MRVGLISKHSAKAKVCQHLRVSQKLPLIMRGLLPALSRSIRAKETKETNLRTTERMRQNGGRAVTKLIQELRDYEFWFL